MRYFDTKKLPFLHSYPLSLSKLFIHSVLLNLLVLLQLGICKFEGKEIVDFARKYLYVCFFLNVIKLVIVKTCSHLRNIALFVQIVF